jgi:uncharacterized membrane protein HdeD (DUF308 family)
MTTPAPDENRTLRVFLIRGVIAIAWAAVFVAVAGSLTTGLTVGAGVLLVVYPLIDAVATLIDARSQHGSARRLLLVNAGSSVLAAVALGVAATRGVAAVFVVFGVWAAVSGAAQLVVALRRRAQLGNQWPLLLPTACRSSAVSPSSSRRQSAIRSWACLRLRGHRRH